MNKLKFNSQVCTTVEQSNRLLELGLKPETADMIHNYDNRSDFYSEWEWIILPYKWHDESLVDDEHIPAWSLHRLMELNSFSIMEGGVIVLSYDNTYDDIIEDIEWAINKGYFNKEYLNE